MARGVKKTSIQVGRAAEGARPSIVLAERLDQLAAVALARTLLDVRGAPVVVDASGVRKLGTHAAQVLASAALTWAADKVSFCVAKASPDFCEAAGWLGLSTLFCTGE